MNIQNKLDGVIMVLCALGLSVVITVACTVAGEDAADAVEVQTPLMERDIYLPGMEFTSLSNSENTTLQLCTNSSNMIVYEFALVSFSSKDEDLRTLGRIAFQQCLKVYSLHVADRA